MTIQRSFLESEIQEWQGGRPLARRTDPPNSHVAAAEQVSTGKADSDADKILALLQLRPVPAWELAQVCLNPRARISQLRQRGHNVVCRQTRNAATGKLDSIYLLDEEGEA